MCSGVNMFVTFLSPSKFKVKVSKDLGLGFLCIVVSGILWLMVMFEKVFFIKF